MLLLLLLTVAPNGRRLVVVQLRDKALYCRPELAPEPNVEDAEYTRSVVSQFLTRRRKFPRDRCIDGDRYI